MMPFLRTHRPADLRRICFIAAALAVLPCPAPAGDTLLDRFKLSPLTEEQQPIIFNPPGFGDGQKAFMRSELSFPAAKTVVYKALYAFGGDAGTEALIHYSVFRARGLHMMSASASLLDEIVGMLSENFTSLTPVRHFKVRNDQGPAEVLLFRWKHRACMGFQLYVGDEIEDFQGPVGILGMSCRQDGTPYTESEAAEMVNALEVRVAFD